MSIVKRWMMFVISVYCLSQAAHCFAQSGSPGQIEKFYFEGNWRSADSLLTRWELTDGRRLRSDAVYLKMKGIRHYYHYEVESAEQSLLLAFDIADRSNNLLLQTEIEEWLGHVYMKRAEPDLAIRAYEEALAIRKTAKFSSGLSDFYLNYFLASAYFVNGEQ